MIPRDEMQDNAVHFIKGINNQNIPGLGAIIIFFDVKQGYPVIAGNVTRGEMQHVLKEVLRALPEVPVREELQ